MRKIIVSFCLLSVFAAAPVGATAPANKYKNCTVLRQVYKNGVAKSPAAAGSTGAFVSPKIYGLNKGLDRDKDGVACES